MMQPHLNGRCLLIMSSLAIWWFLKGIYLCSPAAGRFPWLHVAMQRSSVISALVVTSKTKWRPTKSRHGQGLPTNMDNRRLSVHAWNFFRHFSEHSGTLHFQFPWKWLHRKGTEKYVCISEAANHNRFQTRKIPLCNLLHCVSLVHHSKVLNAWHRVSYTLLKCWEDMCRWFNLRGSICSETRRSIKIDIYVQCTPHIDPRNSSTMQNLQWMSDGRPKWQKEDESEFGELKCLIWVSP